MANRKRKTRSNQKNSFTLLSHNSSLDSEPSQNPQICNEPSKGNRSLARATSGAIGASSAPVVPSERDASIPPVAPAVDTGAGNAEVGSPTLLENYSEQVLGMLRPVLDRLKYLESRLESYEAQNTHQSIGNVSGAVAANRSGHVHCSCVTSGSQGAASVAKSLEAITLVPAISNHTHSLQHASAETIRRFHHLKTSDIRIPTYGGAHEPQTPYEFLTELDKYRKAVDYSETELLAHVVPLSLRDDAELWYRKVGHLQVTWQGFQTAFRREFESPTYNRRLYRELEDRFQGPHEPLSKFICIIDDYFQRLDPNTPQQERVQRILENMHPGYRRKMLDSRKLFNSVQEMLDEAYNAQASFAFDREYKVPGGSASIEPTLACSPEQARIEQNPYDPQQLPFNKSPNPDSSYPTSTTKPPY